MDDILQGYVAVDAEKFMATLINEHWDRDQKVGMLCELVRGLKPEDWMKVRCAYQESLPTHEGRAFPLQGIHKAEILPPHECTQAAPDRERPKYLRHPPLYEPTGKEDR